jgi:hypothetical protein
MPDHDSTAKKPKPDGPDWPAYVRARLDLTGLSPERQVYIVRDVAGQLDECYRDMIARGVDPRAAEVGTQSQITDWPAFAASVTRAAGRTARRDPLTTDVRPPHRTTAGRMEHAMTTITREIRLAIRSLAKRPGFTAVAVLTLGLGIGATTAIFGVVRGVLISPLPYADSDRLVVVWGQLTNRGVPKFPVSPLDLRDYQSMTTIFSDVAGVFAGNQTLNDGDAPPEQIQVAGVSPSFFEVAGLMPIHGRGFAPTDAAAQQGRFLHAGSIAASACVLQVID